MARHSLDAAAGAGEMPMKSPTFSRGPRKKKKLVKAEAKGGFAAPKAGGMGVGAGTKGMY